MRSLLSVFGASLVVLASVTFCVAETPTTQPKPEGMVWVPAGDLTMGTDDPNSMPNERPAHQVKLDGFWMDETTVTNAQFAKFIAATNYVTTAERPVNWEELKKQVPPGTPKPAEDMLKPGSLVFTPPTGPVNLRNLGNWWTWTTGACWKHPQGPNSNIDGKDDLPVVQVSWDDAVAYAKWAGKELPTEAQWEYAARGGAKTNTRYWWGDEFKRDGKYMANTFDGQFPFRNTGEDGFIGVAPVKAFPANGYDLYGMAGNVWQWTSDLYRADAHEQAAIVCSRNGLGCLINPKGPLTSVDPTRGIADATERVTKGGSYLCNPSYCESYRPTARRGTPPDTGSEHVGFRCVINLPVATADKK